MQLAGDATAARFLARGEKNPTRVAPLSQPDVAAPVASAQQTACVSGPATVWGLKGSKVLEAPCENRDELSRSLACE